VGVPFHNAKIFILGVAFKRDIDDTRESPALKIMEFLAQRGATEISYHDFFVPEIKVNGTLYQSQPITAENLKAADVVVITTDHSQYDPEMIVKNANAVVDTRNLTKNVRSGREKITKLGSGIRF